MVKKWMPVLAGNVNRDKLTMCHIMARTMPVQAVVEKASNCSDSSMEMRAFTRFKYGGKLYSILSNLSGKMGEVAVQ